MAKEMLVVGGPNGSGKTTYVQEFLTRFPWPYLSADLIAEELGIPDEPHGLVTAGRELLNRLQSHIAGDDSFVVESTLSGRTFRRVIRAAKDNGFEITIVFVFLDSPDSCVRRVQERVRKGGHAVSEADIRRRFPRGLSNFWNLYRHVADDWCITYNANGEFESIAVGVGNDYTVRNEMVFQQYLEFATVDA